MNVIVVLFVLAVVMILLSRCLHVVAPQTVDVVDRVGRQRALGPGLHWILPGMDQIATVDMRPRGHPVPVVCRTVDSSATWITVDVIERVADPLTVIEHSVVLDQGDQLLRHVVTSIVAHRSDDDTWMKLDELADHIRWTYEPMRLEQGIAIESLSISRVDFEPVVAESYRAVLLAQNERAVRVLNAGTDALTARTRAETEAAVIRTRDGVLRDVDDRVMEWQRIETIQTAMPDATLVIGHLPWQPPQPEERRHPPEGNPSE